MAGLRIDRPCKVRKAAPGRWEWTCLCSPAAWPCTGRGASWLAAQTAADDHMTVSHPAAVQAPQLAPVIDLEAYRITKPNGAGVVLYLPRRSGGDAA